jgi:hypothetical protein
MYIHLAGFEWKTLQVIAEGGSISNTKVVSSLLLGNPLFC